MENKKIKIEKIVKKLEGENIRPTVNKVCILSLFRLGGTLSPFADKDLILKIINKEK